MPASLNSCHPNSRAPGRIVVSLTAFFSSVACSDHVKLWGTSGMSGTRAGTQADAVESVPAVESAPAAVITSATSSQCPFDCNQPCGPAKFGAWTVTLGALGDVLVQGDSGRGNLIIGALPGGAIFATDKTDAQDPTRSSAVRITCATSIEIKTGSGPKNVLVRLGPSDGSRIARFDNHITIRSEGTTTETTFIKGSKFSDTIYDGPGSDTIHAREGRDTIHVRRGGLDVVYAGPGDDKILAGTSDAMTRFAGLILFGGSDRDSIEVGSGGIETTPGGVALAAEDQVVRGEIRALGQIGAEAGSCAGQGVCVGSGLSSPDGDLSDDPL